MKVRNKIISAVCALSMAFSMVGAFTVTTNAATDDPTLTAWVSKQPTSEDKTFEVSFKFEGVDTSVERFAGISTVSFGLKSEKLAEVLDLTYGKFRDGFEPVSKLEDSFGDVMKPTGNFASQDHSYMMAYSIEPPITVDKSDILTLKMMLKEDISSDIALTPDGSEIIATNLNAENPSPGHVYEDGTKYCAENSNLNIDYSNAIIKATVEGPGVSITDVSMPTAPSRVVERGTVTGVKATVVLTGGATNDAVTWTLTGNNDATNTKIEKVSNTEASLTISATETAKKITVTATSEQDPNVSKSIEVTINQPKELTMTVQKATGTSSFNAFDVNVKASSGSVLTKDFDVIVQGYDANGTPVGYAIYKGISKDNIPAAGYNFTAMLGGATEVKAWAVTDADYAQDMLGTVIANPVSTNETITK